MNSIYSLNKEFSKSYEIIYVKEENVKKNL